MLPVVIALSLDLVDGGVRDDRGTMRCFLYENAKDFPVNTDGAVARASAVPSAGQARMRSFEQA